LAHQLRHTLSAFAWLPMRLPMPRRRTARSSHIHADHAARDPVLAVEPRCRGLARLVDVRMWVISEPQVCSTKIGRSGGNEFPSTKETRFAYR